MSSRPGHDADCAGGYVCEASCGRGTGDPMIDGDGATRAKYALAAMTKERDAAIQRAATAEADTVARIVSMIRAKVQHIAGLRPYDEYRSGGADSLEVLAADIEAGAWRGKEGA